MVVGKAFEGGGEDRAAGFDAAGSTVGRYDGDEFGLFEGLESGFAVAGFESVGEEELVVSDAGIVGEGFDDEPGLFGRPAPITPVGVKDVHFEDFGGGLFDNFMNGF